MLVCDMGHSTIKPHFHAEISGNFTFKVSSSTDPENTETIEASVFMIADYNENLDKNICFFLNELLGYGHAYSELAILQRKTLRQ